MSNHDRAPRSDPTLEQHATAQRYLIQALSLAQTSGDRALGAEILAGMSHQAAYLGQPHDAVDMARAAGHCATRAGQPVLLAEAHAVEAHGHALAGNRHSALASLAAAEQALAAADTTDVPPWLGYFDSAYLAAKSAHTLHAAGESAAAIRHAERSLEMQDGYARGRVFNLVLLATAQAETGQLDQAAHTGTVALGSASALESARSVNYLRGLLQRLSLHQTVAEVCVFQQQARELVSARSAAPALPSGR